ncbi:MAG: AAA family ATPase [Methanospirillum sp.]|uniref:AAA family ATPase n=1 Tax=Methanospirillum sp. TaxID=45200 RepID=UPI002372F480|nr:AAA family ATPase [Methanospirillum sp.]MDD1728077.1 AAA family ATPase [Methanospirillum sp.]
MQLTEFRVQNYKIINDTGWIPVGNLTIFVGKNESGKSAIFRALSKLNPSDGEGYDGLKEFPRQRYAEEITRTDWPVASGKFKLIPREQEEISNLSELCREVEGVEVTRHYTGKYGITYHPDIGVDLVTATELIYVIDVAIEQMRNLIAPEGRGDVLGRIKGELLSILEEQKEAASHGAQVQKRQITDLINMIKTRGNEQWQMELINPVCEPMYGLVRQIEVYESLMAANRYIIDHLPKFVYFDQYNVIESAIHIPTFIATLKSHPDSPGLRATNCLFRHVNLDLDILDKLGTHKNATDENPLIRRQVDERSILLSTASNQMSRRFEDWWEQRRLRFRYDIDGDYFRIWVSDNLDPSEIELEQRSSGLQYFFSFYLIFLVESGDVYQDTILLLDEPGLQLHATAQQRTVKFFERLSQDNQILFSTHSPFMIDLDHMDRVRTVYESPDGTTKVSATEWPKDHDSLFPLEAALAYRIASRTFVAGRQLLVDDIVDLWLLQAMNYAVEKIGKPGLDPDITITPAGGSANLLPLSTLIRSHENQVSVLLSGTGIPAEVLTQLTGITAIRKKFLLLYSQITGNAGSTIEDLFTPEYYTRCVKEVYPNMVVTPVPSKDPAERGEVPGILHAVSETIERRQGEQFERWRVAELLSDRICEAPGMVDEETVQRFVRLFAEVNEATSGRLSPV